MYTKTVRKPNKNKRISPSETAFIGAIITLIGGFFISYNYIESQKIMAYDYMANAFYDGNQVTVAENENNQTEEKKEGLSGEITNDYIGYLNIPKINRKYEKNKLNYIYESFDKGLNEVDVISGCFFIIRLSALEIKLMSL